jgi:hypothetical protein
MSSRLSMVRPYQSLGTLHIPAEYLLELGAFTAPDFSTGIIVTYKL